MVKSQDLHFVTINGRWFKRLILGDSYMAAQIEENLTKFGPSDLVPPLVSRFEDEVWVEYVDGRPIRDLNEEIVRKLAEFYATVHVRRPRMVAIEETGRPARLFQDLRFLSQAGILDTAKYEALAEAAGRLIPEQVAIGFDYVDPVLKNFVIRDDTGGICAIDVESLRDDQVIGTGVARACVHWLAPHREVFFEHFARAGGPPFTAYFPFVEFCLRARWTKTNYLTGKLKYVDPALFDRFLGP